MHAGIHPPGRHPPCRVHVGIDMATAADGTYPTGMHSCFNNRFAKRTVSMYIIRQPTFHSVLVMKNHDTVWDLTAVQLKMNLGGGSLIAIKSPVFPVL